MRSKNHMLPVKMMIASVDFDKSGLCIPTRIKINMNSVTWRT